MKIFLSGRNSTTALTVSSTSSFRHYLSTMNLLSMNFDASESLFVCLDLDRDSLRFMKVHKIPKDRALLVRYEPRVVCPENYRDSYLARFGKVIDIGRPWASQGANWPQNWPPKISRATGGLPQNQNRLVMVNANKLSFIKGEMYSLRRLSMRTLPLDTFGFGWDNTWPQKIRTLAGELLISVRNHQIPSLLASRWWFSHPRNYLGECSNKIEVMSNYRFALVIENDLSFVSEKLFDALFSGCIPIYVGANLEFLDLPSGLVFESAANSRDILATFVRAQGVEFNAWSKLRDSYLANESTIRDNASSEVFREISEIILGS